MKSNKTIGIYIIIVIILVLVPIFVGIGTAADILNWATNDNDWIGFWGSYVGTIVGSLVTLVVLHNTLNDNRKARERAENVDYYNRLIAVHSSFIVAVADYFACITKTMAKREDSMYRECIHTGNQLSKVSNELSIRLQLKSENESIRNIIKMTDELADRVEEVAGILDECVKVQFCYKLQNEEMIEKMDSILNDINQYTNKFTEMIKYELHNE